MVSGKSLRRFAIMFGAAALIACLAGLASLSFSHRVANAENDESNAPVVGVWEVNVGNAPFGPHLFTFHSDHTFLSSNPDAGDLIPATPMAGASGRDGARLRAYLRSTMPTERRTGSLAR